MKGGSICFCIPAGRKHKHDGTDESSSGGKPSRRKSHKKGKKRDHGDEEGPAESADVGGTGNHPGGVDAGMAVAAVTAAQMSSGDGSSHGGGGGDGGG